MDIYNLNTKCKFVGDGRGELDTQRRSLYAGSRWAPGQRHTAECAGALPVALRGRLDPDRIVPYAGISTTTGYRWFRFQPRPAGFSMRRGSITTILG